MLQANEKAFMMKSVLFVVVVVVIRCGCVFNATPFFCVVENKRGGGEKEGECVWEVLK